MNMKISFFVVLSINFRPFLEVFFVLSIYYSVISMNKYVFDTGKDRNYHALCAVTTRNHELHQWNDTMFYISLTIQSLLKKKKREQELLHRVLNITKLQMSDWHTAKINSCRTISPGPITYRIFYLHWFYW